MSKRQRTDGGMSKRQQRARMASMAIARKYPYSEYGRIMHKRGTEAGLARFGESYRSASQSQRANRKAAGYYGRGMYIPPIPTPKFKVQGRGTSFIFARDY